MKTKEQTIIENRTENRWREESRNVKKVKENSRKQMKRREEIKVEERDKIWKQKNRKEKENKRNEKWKTVEPKKKKRHEVNRWGTKREEFIKELKRKQERREQTRRYLILMNYYMTALKSLMGVAHDIPAIKAAVKWRYEDPMPRDISGGDHPRHAKTFRAGHRMTSAPSMGHAHYVTNTGHTSAASRAREWSISSGTSAKGMKTNPPIHPPPSPALLSTL